MLSGHAELMAEHITLRKKSLGNSDHDMGAA